MSTTAKDGGPAFPFIVRGSISDHQAHHPGMTLRDYFAAHMPESAVVQFIMNSHGVQAGEHLPIIARQRYAYADAMLAERARPTESPRGEGHGGM